MYCQHRYVQRCNEGGVTMTKFSEKAYKKMTEFLTNGGMYFIFGLGIIAIIFAIIGHYATVGFNIWAFLFFELPLYIFCCWALYKAFKMYKKNQ